MALIIPPGYLQAVYVLQLDGDGEDMVVTCGHEIDSASGATGEDAPNDLFGAFATNILPVSFGAHYTLDSVVCYVGQDGPTTVEISTATPDTGIGAATTLPPNSAYLVRKRTDLGGRRGRGRMYLPCVAEGAVDNVGNVSSGTVAAIQTALDEWHEHLTALVGGRLYPPVVLHRSEGIGTEPAPTPVTRFTIDSKIATQRRRLRP